MLLQYLWEAIEIQIQELPQLRTIPLVAPNLQFNPRTGDDRVRLGIDSRGLLFKRVQDTRWYADQEDNDLVELQSILRDFKPRGGSFYVSGVKVYYRETDDPTVKHKDMVSLWFDINRASWRKPRSLNKKWTEEDTRMFVKRVSRQS